MFPPFFFMVAFSFIYLYWVLVAFSGPTAAGDGQPGFAVAAINSTAAYISPVAQMLSMIAKFLAEPGSTMQGLAQPVGSPTLGLTLEKAGFGTTHPFCVHAAAICSSSGSGPSRVLAINRCNHTVAMSLASTCKGGASNWSAISVYNASVAPAGRDWAKASGPPPWRPMVPLGQPSGTGDPALSPYALSVITL